MEVVLGTVSSVIGTLEQIFAFLGSVMGVDPILILPVVVLVWISRNFFGYIFKKLFGKGFVEEYRKSGISLVIILVSNLLVWLFGSCGGEYTVLRCGLVLGSVSALTYQLFKPIIRKLIKKLPKLILSRMGIESDEEPSKQV